MSIWRGIGYNIDAAFKYSNGKTYFFKGYGYWEFNDDLMEVAHPRPKLNARKWMHCPRLVNEVDEEQTWTAPLISERNETMIYYSPTSTASWNQAERGMALWIALFLISCWFWTNISSTTV